MLGGGCPLDFSKKDGRVEGVERVTRHASLWVLGMFGLGYAASAVYATQFAFGAMPISSVILGYHQDYLNRRNGKLSPEKDALTSHAPFGAVIQGRQSWSDIQKEIKVENMAAGASVALLLAMRRYSVARKLLQK